METVDYTLKVPKECKEVVDALSAIVAHFKSGKGVSEAALLLPELLNAVAGVDQVLDEVKSDGKDELAAYLVHKVWTALEAPPAVPTPAAAT